MLASKTMRAFVVTSDGAPLGQVAMPEPGRDEVLVRGRACALNHADLCMRAGRSHGVDGGGGAVLGLEWAGEVMRSGAHVRGFDPRDAVMGGGKGAFAEYAVADAGRVAHLPRDMPFERPAALPVALQTMHDAI